MSLTKKVQKFDKGTGRLITIRQRPTRRREVCCAKCGGVFKTSSATRHECEKCQPKCRRHRPDPKRINMPGNGGYRPGTSNFYDRRKQALLNQTGKKAEGVVDLHEVKRALSIALNG